MKNNYIRGLLVALVGALSFGLQAQTITTPRTPSPAASVSQTIGISTVSVKYSRPSVKGRTVWGDLVPYGWNVQAFGTPNLAPWRAGANENTVIEFSHDAKLCGKSVPAGQYGLFMVINKDNTGEVILSKDHHSWGNFFYDPARDFLRANIQLRDISHTELLTYDFINMTKNTAELVLNWEKKQFVIPIEFAVDEIVLENAEDELKGAMGFTWQAFNSAANYALQNNIHLDKALEWSEKAVAQNAGFATLSTKAGILRATGKNADADKIMDGAMQVANEAEINQYGYNLLNAKRYDEAIKIMTLNTEKHPESANAWDSLGEAYATKGDKANAIKSFKKSLSLNPPANVRANSEKFLKQLGGS